MDTPHPAVLFIADLCRELGISRRTIARWRRSGRFPFPLIDVGGRKAVSRVALDRYLASAPMGRRLGRVA